MESMSKKSKSCESNEDRLSGMPDEVILHILSLMPTLDAVRTMLLRRFGDLWTMVPALHFDFDEYCNRMLRMDDVLPSIIDEFFSYSRCVRNVLMLYRRSTIDTFRLCFGNYQEFFDDDAKLVADVQMWLRFATDKKVKDLCFSCIFADISPPRHVFTSQSLSTLTLSGCTIEHYAHLSQPHMGMLKKLSLELVRGSTKAYNQLISGCPSLQELVIVCTLDREVGFLNISAPSLIKLYLRQLHYPCTLNCPRLKMLDIGVLETSSRFQLSVIGALSLQEVNIECLSTRCYSGEVQPIFMRIQNAEVFTLSCQAFKGISSIRKIEFPQNRWRRIVLHLEWNGERCLEVIFKLIKNSINLEELTIYAGETWSDCELFCPKLTACVLPLLKTVTIHGNHGYRKWCEGQLQVIEFLLRNAVVLEKMVITFEENILTAVEKFDLVKQVSTFRRASANATVIFA